MINADLLSSENFTISSNASGEETSITTSGFEISSKESFSSNSQFDSIKVAIFLPKFLLFFEATQPIRFMLLCFSTSINIDDA